MSDTKINDGGPAFPVPEIGMNYIPVQLQGMSLRQYAAIKLRVPNSGTGWLDKMIIESKRDELAGQALAGILQTTWYDEDERPYAETGPNLASDAYTIADAMLAARNAK